MTRYKLTTGIDKLKRTDGDDVFEAYLHNDAGGAYTLNSDDRIDGGLGYDRIKVVIGRDPITPYLKNVETGLFYSASPTSMLDLSHALQMSSLEFSGSTRDGARFLKISKARAVEELTISGGDLETYLIAGLAPERHETFHLNVNRSHELHIRAKQFGDARFDRLEIVAQSAQFSIIGDLADAETVSIFSKGDSTNQINFRPDGTSGIRSLFLGGGESIFIRSRADLLLGLERFDSTAMTPSADVRAEIGGAALLSVRGGRSAEKLDLASIGGTEKHRAEVRLGGGSDHISLAYAFDASKQFYDGGSGVDKLGLMGAAAALGSAVKNFETIEVRNAVGTYDVTGLNLRSFQLITTQGAVSVEGLAQDAELEVSSDVADISVSVADSSGSTEDGLYLVLIGGADVGSGAAGFAAEHLTQLRIENRSVGGTVHLAQLGSDSDAASVEILAGGRIALAGTDGMATYIERLAVNEGASVDLSDLAGRSGVFVDGGATITGASGDDVLVGGDGDDLIGTGAGENTVYGSLGADAVTLGDGTDTLVFTAQEQSSHGSGHDAIEGFDAEFDLIDLSAIPVTINFRGTVPNQTAGLGVLSVSYAGAFFNTSDDTLYIDIDKDMQITSDDMQVVLTGVESLSTSNFVL